MTKATDGSWHVIMASMTPPVPVIIVAAIERTTRAIGNNNNLLWHVPEDLRRFKALTLGHPVILGRKTFESIVAILGKPLPKRTNIVITRNPDYGYSGDNVIVTSSLEAAFTAAMIESPTEIHIGGGALLYREALPYVEKLHLTLFDDPTVIADSFFPDYTQDFEVVFEHPAATHDGIHYQWIDYTRSKQQEYRNNVQH